MEYVDALEVTIRNAVPKEWVAEYDAFLAKGHPNSKNFPLMNPFHVLLILIAYVSSIFIGKIIMKNRKEFKLKTFSLFHNTFLVLLSSYMCFESIRQAYLGGYSVWGNGVVEGEKGMPMARILWIFYFSKIIEFIDTWIMVLKKNNRQISFLHLYHHTTIFAIWWGVVYFAPGGEGYFTAALNSFIHVIMYSYYLLASFGITVPWKKYITQAQMTQFFIMFLEATYIAVSPPKNYPVALAYILFIYMITLLILFANFYIKNMSAQRAARQQQVKPAKKDE